MRHAGWISVMTLAVLAGLSSPLAAQQDAGVLQKALDKTVDISIANVPIGQVFQQISAKTGVKFSLSSDAVDSLPYGDQTPLKIKIENTSLRNSLSPMLAKLALQWTIEGDTVKIIPKESLYRMGRRASFEELTILGKICSMPLKPANTGGSAISQLQELTARPNLKLVFPQGVEGGPNIERADKSLPCSAVEWLDALCDPQGWTWYLRDDEIRIIETKAQIDRQLRKVISVRYVNADLMTVLLDMAKRARVKLIMEPGVLDLVSNDKKINFNLSMSDATIAQALEAVAGATGLKFVRTNEGVRVEASDVLKSANTQPANDQTRRRPPFFLKMDIKQPNGVSAEVYITPDELPPELVEYIQAQKAKYVQKLMESVPAPTTRPASQPAAASRPATAPAKPAEPTIEGGKG